MLNLMCPYCPYKVAALIAYTGLDFYLWIKHMTALLRLTRLVKSRISLRFLRCGALFQKAPSCEPVRKKGGQSGLTPEIPSITKLSPSAAIKNYSPLLGKYPTVKFRALIILRQPKRKSAQKMRRTQEARSVCEYKGGRVSTRQILQLCFM